jgi:hypothetical protein
MMLKGLTCVWKAWKNIDLDAVLNEGIVLIWAEESGRPGWSYHLYSVDLNAGTSQIQTGYSGWPDRTYLTLLGVDEASYVGYWLVVVATNRTLDMPVMFTSQESHADLSERVHAWRRVSVSMAAAMTSVLGFVMRLAWGVWLPSQPS